MTASKFELRRKHLWNELVVLRDMWEQYIFLFNSNERIRLLNACAPWFFRTTQRVMMRDLILGICRFTDNRKMGKHQNVVLECLLDDPAIKEHAGLKEELAEALEKVQELASSIRVHRHKYIAHLDDLTVTDAVAHPIPEIEKGAVGDIIKAMAALYNLHGVRTKQQHSSFKLSPTGSVEALVSILESSERWAEWQEWDEGKGARRRKQT